MGGIDKGSWTGIDFMGTSVEYSSLLLFRKLSYLDGEAFGDNFGWIGGAMITLGSIPEGTFFSTSSPPSKNFLPGLWEFVIPPFEGDANNSCKNFLVADRGGGTGDAVDSNWGTWFGGFIEAPCFVCILYFSLPK